MACNNDGVWNEEGATLAFSLAPAWHQTWCFVGSSLAVFLALLWAPLSMAHSSKSNARKKKKQLRDVIDTIPALAFSSSPDGRMNGESTWWNIQLSRKPVRDQVGDPWFIQTILMNM